MKNIGRVSLYFMLACVVTNSNAMQVEDPHLTINVDGVDTKQPGVSPEITGGRVEISQQGEKHIYWLDTPNTTPSPGSTPETQSKRDFRSALRRNSKPEVSEDMILHK